MLHYYQFEKSSETFPEWKTENACFIYQQKQTKCFTTTVQSKEAKEIMYMHYMLVYSVS